MRGLEGLKLGLTYWIHAAQHVQQALTEPEHCACYWYDSRGEIHPILHRAFFPFVSIIFLLGIYFMVHVFMKSHCIQLTLIYTCWF